MSRFPLSLSLDDSNAMIPEHLLSAQWQVKVWVRLARDGTVQPQRGDWFVKIRRSHLTVTAG